MYDNYRPDPAGPPDIPRLAYVFGLHQLARALEGVAKSRLVAAADLHDLRYPANKMKNKSKATIAALIDFLVAEAQDGRV